MGPASSGPQGGPGFGALGTSRGPGTQNPKSKIQNPKSKTYNPKPKTLKPQNQSTGLLALEFKYIYIETERERDRWRRFRGLGFRVCLRWIPQTLNPSHVGSSLWPFAHGPQNYGCSRRGRKNTGTARGLCRDKDKGLKGSMNAGIYSPTPPSAPVSRLLALLVRGTGPSLLKDPKPYTETPNQRLQHPGCLCEVHGLIGLQQRAPGSYG